MKKITFLIVALLIVGASFAQMKPAAPVLAFKETKFSFGKIKQHVPVTHVFTFKNVSNKPVVIESAVAGCGCTTPVYPKGVIAKGASNSIKVTFNAESPNTFTKDVTVKVANVAEPIILNISGDVVEQKATTAKN